MKLTKFQAYKMCRTQEERSDWMTDFFARNIQAIDRRRGEPQKLDPECTFETYKVNRQIPGQVKAAKVCRLFADRLAQRIFDDQNSAVGLLLQGEPGCGKTHLAQAIISAVKKTAPGYYMTARELFDFLLKKDAEGNTRADRRRNLLQVGVLAIDEVGRSSITDWERITLRDLCDAREDMGLPTILVTNLDDDEIVSALDPTFVSRMATRCYRLIFDWEDYRQQHGLRDANPEEIF